MKLRLSFASISVMAPGHPEILAAYVHHRLERLNLTMAAMKALGGPSEPTVGKIVAGRLTKPKTVTLTKLDTALQWKPGSAAAAFYDAAEPVALGEQRDHEPLRLGGGEIEIDTEQVLGLMEVQRQLNEIADQDAVPSLEAIRAIAATLDAEVSQIAVRWFSVMMSRNRPDGSLHPALADLLAEALAVPVDPRDPNAEDRLYLRWLREGQATVGVDDAQHQAFHDRHQAQRRR